MLVRAGATVVMYQVDTMLVTTDAVPVVMDKLDRMLVVIVRAVIVMVVIAGARQY